MYAENRKSSDGCTACARINTPLILTGRPPRSHGNSAADQIGHPWSTRVRVSFFLFLFSSAIATGRYICNTRRSDYCSSFARAYSTKYFETFVRNRKPLVTSGNRIRRLAAGGFGGRKCFVGRRAHLVPIGKRVAFCVRLTRTRQSVPVVFFFSF